MALPLCYPAFTKPIANQEANSRPQRHRGAGSARPSDPDPGRAPDPSDRPLFPTITSERPRLPRAPTDIISARLADEYLTVAEVATELKVNEQTIRNWIDRGELPAVRVGSRRVRVRRPDLEAFVVATSGAGSSEAADDNADQSATVTVEGDVVRVRVPTMTADERRRFATVLREVADALDRDA